MIKIKRIYDEVSPGDGYRILVDRLWPRGISKDKAKIDLWLKEISPSTKLRKLFHHNASQWKEFLNEYRSELEEKKELIDRVNQIEKEEKTVTLLYAAKDETFNNAAALKKILAEEK